MNEVHYVEVMGHDADQRLDNFLIKKLKGVPKSHIYRMIRHGEVRVDKKRARPNTRLVEGNKVRIPPVRMSEEKATIISLKKEQILLDAILYEDDKFLVINKPSGIAVHGGSGVSYGVIEALRNARNDLPYLELVHRLDRDTSGCLLIAKKRSALRSIQALIAQRAIHKMYWALLAHPWIGKTSCCVDLALEKNTLRSGERMVIVNPNGKPSRTHFTCLASYKNACWMEVNLETGRTHQIRVHSAHIGHFVIGDEKYGEVDKKISLPFTPRRLYLHAREIRFTLDGRNYAFEANTDLLFQEALNKLKEGNV